MSRLAEGGRAMAPRTPPLAERLAEPWEGVKYRHKDSLCSESLPARRLRGQ